MDIKKILRNSAKSLRSSYSEEFLVHESKKLHTVLFESDVWKKANTVGITYSLENEINTFPLFEKGWMEGKKIVSPIALFSNREMKFKEVKSFQDFQRTKNGLYEPIDRDGVFCNEIDLLIVPGLVFDLYGYRIGFGGGFYDKYIAQYKGETVGMCFSWEKVESIPHESFDLPVQYVITQKGMEKTIQRKQSNKEK